MFRNHLKTAWRNLFRSKLYSAITLVGLTLGLAVGVMVLLWVEDEYGFDRSLPQAANIYRLGIDGGGSGDKKQIFNYIIAPIATFAKRELPAVTEAVRIVPIAHSPVFKTGDKTFAEENSLAVVDPSFFSVFDQPLVMGDPKNPFPGLYSMVVTESEARRYFGSANPMGQRVTDAEKHVYTVSGVIRDPAKNVTERYSMLLPMALLNQDMYVDRPTSYNGTGRLLSMDQDWVNFGYKVYLQVKPGTDIAQLRAGLRAIHEKNHPEDAPCPYFAMPLPAMHLQTIDGEDAGLSTARIFAGIAGLLLLIACINYVNLSTARAITRAKGVSVRKIIGARRSHLYVQFFLETTLLFIAAAVLATGLIVLLLPAYNQFSGKSLDFSLSDPRIWRTMGIAFLVTLAGSGVYPALLLSGFQPMLALRGKIRAGFGATRFREALVVGQFAISFLLIAGTLLITRQLDFIQHRSLGYDKENMMFLRFPSLDKHYDAIRAELLKDPSVAGVTRASSDIVDLQNWTGDLDWEGKQPNQAVYLKLMEVDQYYLPLYKIPLVAGENFRGEGSDSARFILNEEAVRQIGFKDPIGKRLRVQQVNGVIAGVVKDFHFTSMKKKIGAAVFLYRSNDCWQLSVKTRPGQAAAAIAAVQKQFRIFGRDEPFRYSFLDENFLRLYKSEERTAALFRIFTAVAIFISCLGLFGLTTYIAAVRTREIGIRKVLGAGIPGIIGLLSRDFMKLVVLSIALAAPLAWYGAHRWLADFAYRIDPGWTLFAWAALAILIVAFVTVSARTIQAALANPVTSLRTE